MFYCADNIENILYQSMSPLSFHQLHQWKTFDSQCHSNFFLSTDVITTCCLFTVLLPSFNNVVSSKKTTILEGIQIRKARIQSYVENIFSGSLAIQDLVSRSKEKLDITSGSFCNMTRTTNLT